MKKFISIVLGCFLSVSTLSLAQVGPDSCDQFLKALENGTISKFYIAQLQDSDESQLLLAQYGLLETEEFNQAVFLSLRREGIKLRVDGLKEHHIRFSNQLFNFTEKLSKFIAGWEVMQSFFTASVLDSYVDILSAKPKNRINSFYTARAKTLVAALKKSGQGRYAFSQTLRLALANTLVHAQSLIEQNCELYSTSMPFYYGLDIGVLPLSYQPIAPVRPNFLNVLNSGEQTQTANSILKTIPKSLDNQSPLTFKNLCSATEPLKLNKVDIAYLDHLDLIDYSIQAKNIENQYRLIDQQTATYRKQGPNDKIEESELEQAAPELYRFSEAVEQASAALSKKIRSDSLALQNLQRRLNSSQSQDDQLKMLNIVIKVASAELEHISNVLLRLAVEHREVKTLLYIWNQKQSAHVTPQLLPPPIVRGKPAPKTDVQKALKELSYAKDHKPLYDQFLNDAQIWDSNPEGQVSAMYELFEHNFSLAYSRHYIALLKEPSLSFDFKQNLYDLIKRNVHEDFTLEPFKEVAIRQNLVVFNVRN